MASADDFVPKNDAEFIGQTAVSRQQERQEIRACLLSLTAVRYPLTGA